MAFKGIVASSNYAFNAASKTITFSNDYLGMALSDITYITNIKNGVATVIYDPFDATKGGVLSGLTLTLSFNTTTMSNSDPLQIIVGFTPLNSDPLLVKPVDTNSTIDQTQLLQNISDNLDFLNLALDQSEGVEINIRDKSIKKDTQGAIVPSDAPNPIFVSLNGSAVNNVSDVIDTAGYLSTSFTLRSPSTWSVQFLIEGSNDRSTYFVIPITYTFTGGGTFSVNGNINIGNNVDIALHVSNFYRFIRLRISSFTSASGIMTGTAFLKAYPMTPQIPSANLNVSVNNTVSTSTAVSSVGASTIAGNATQGYNAFQTWGSTISVAGNAQPNSGSAIPYPIITGGTSPPVTGNLAGIVRPLILDNSGRTVLGTDNAFLNTPTLGSTKESLSAGTTRGVGGVPNNMVGMQSLTVTDVAQDFGDTQVMLMRQILTELKILNQQFAEMPNMLNNASYELSEPQEYRNDPTFDTNN